MSDGSGTAPTSRGTASRRRERRERQRATANALDASGRSSVNGGSLDATRSSRRAEDVSDILTYDPMDGGVGDRDRRGVTTRTANATGMDVNAPAASPGGKFDATSLLALLGDAVDAPRKDASEERRAVAKVEEMTKRRTMVNADAEEVRVERRETRVASEGGGNSSGAPTTSRERREKRRAERNAKEQQTAMTTNVNVNKKSTGAVGSALKTATTSSSLKVPEYSFVMLKDEDEGGRAPRKSVTFDANEESTVIGDSDSPAVKTSRPVGAGGGVWSQAAETMSFGASRGGGVKPTAVQLADADDSVVRDSSKENSVAGEVSPQKEADNVVLALPSTRRRFKEVSNAALGATRLAKTRKDDGAPPADDIQAEDSEILALPSTRRRMKEAGIAAGFLGALRSRKTASSGRVEPERSTATTRTERSTGSRDTHDSLRLQYQQGDHDEIDDLLQHRRGHLLKKLARLLNVYLDKLTGFKVVPTYPLDERISRFVIGKGIEI